MLRTVARPLLGRAPALGRSHRHYRRGGDRRGRTDRTRLRVVVDTIVGECKTGVAKHLAGPDRCSQVIAGSGEAPSELGICGQPRPLAGVMSIVPETHEPRPHRDYGRSPRPVRASAAADRRDDWSPAGVTAALGDSTEPAVVFTGIASFCVPQFCDACVIDIMEQDSPGYRIAEPAEFRVEDQSRAFASEQQLTVVFEGRPDGTEPGYVGQAVFSWYTRAPSRDDEVALAILVERAVSAVAVQRSKWRASEALARAANLEIALRSSREIGAAIGILMSRYRIATDSAFEMLRLVSQHTNRKVREVAADVVETGELPVPPG